MSSTNQRTAKPTVTSNDPATAPRAPYEPPAVVEDLPMEAQTLACSKAPGTCTTGQKRT